MKRNFNFFDAMTCVIFHLIVTGHLNEWFFFLPWALEICFNLLELFSVGDRIKVFIMRKVLDYKVKEAHKHARKSGNPGSQETENYFKSKF